MNTIGNMTEGETLYMINPAKGIYSMRIDSITPFGDTRRYTLKPVNIDDAKPFYLIITGSDLGQPCIYDSGMFFGSDLKILCSWSRQNIINDMLECIDKLLLDKGKYHNIEKFYKDYLNK